MPVDITESSSWNNDTIVGPNGLDPRVGTWALVRAFLQSIADRTRHLYVKAAKVDVANTFTEGQTVNTPSNETPLLRTTQTAEDGTAGALWQLVFEAPILPSDDRKVRIYSGASPSGGAEDGYLAVTVNALYSSDTSDKWYADDDSQDAAALILGSAITAIHSKAAGDPHWNWFAGGGHYGSLALDTLLASNVTVGAGGEFNYTGRSHVDWIVPLTSSSGETFLQTDGSYKVGTDGAAFALRLPPGAEITSDVRVVVSQASTSLCYAELARRSKGDIIFSALPTLSTIDGSNAPSATATVQTIVITASGHVIDGDYEYLVIFKRAHADDQIGRISLNWNDPGPRPMG